MLSVSNTLFHLTKAKQGDENSKRILVENNLLLVKSIVNRFKNRGADYDDLVQIGSLGLLKAIQNFNNEFGVKFSTYAVPLIIGEIKRYLRDDGEIKISRIIKYNAYNINKFVDNYISKNNVEPSVEEISVGLNLTKEDIALALDSSKNLISLYETVDDGEEKSQELIEKIPSKEGVDDLFNKVYVKNLLSKLTERERKIIVLRYFRDKTQGEVAKILGVSQVQISRLENKILLRLRDLA